MRKHNTTTKGVLLFNLITVFIIYGSVSATTSFSATSLFSDNFNTEKRTEWIETLGQSGSWEVQNGEYRGTVIKSGSDDTPSTSFVGNTDWSDYTLKVKLYGEQGVDKVIYFRYLPEIDSTYGVNFSNGNSNNIVLCKRLNGGATNCPKSGSYPISSQSWYQVEITGSQSQLTISINNQPVISYQDPTNPILNGKIALVIHPGAYCGNNCLTSVRFDDVEVHGEGTPLLLPTPSPTPLPTPTPTPSPMPVPYFNQTADPWGSEEYNHASSWVPAVSNFLFSRWGCAVTSAAMVMRFHGVELGPSGQITDPQSLNSWLKSQPDGYFGNGNTNWMALTRYARQAKETYPSQPNLEFSSSPSTQTSDLDLELDATRPAILRVDNDLGGTHFLVATGKQPPTYSINDPYYPSRNQLSDYLDSFTGIRKFSKSETDLSYMFFLLDQSIDLSLSESNGNTNFPLLFHDVEPPLGDPESGESSGKTLYSLGLPKPFSGTYFLTLSTATPTAYLLSGYIYDITAQVIIDQIPGILSPGNPETIKINFDKASTDNSRANKEVNYALLKKDLDEAINLGLIKNRRLARSLLFVINRAERLHQRNLHEAEKKLLQTLSALLKGPVGSILADPETVRILTSDIEKLDPHPGDPAP